ncbi:transglutaminase family protein [Sphingomonas sp. CA1-15]|uniref:Transglutaminase family protein n=1 Tax=Sphingomonas immobilis TaxID=3063997 RepID=A0ABT8ZX63_9SPHN|nr:transglutaminase family protein [Sphingomonas sp. CA1-15]
MVEGSPVAGVSLAAGPTLAEEAKAVCRCMNIPARHCTGYRGDKGLPTLVGDMDFSACSEAYLGGRSYVFDTRHNYPRKCCTLMARGRDAIDVALTNRSGPAQLTRSDLHQ